jgi:hypothetical protein
VLQEPVSGLTERHELFVRLLALIGWGAVGVSLGGFAPKGGPNLVLRRVARQLQPAQEFALQLVMVLARLLSRWR